MKKMRIQRALEELKDALCEKYGIKVHLDGWVHTSENPCMTQSKAGNLSVVLAKELGGSVDRLGNSYRVKNSDLDSFYILFPEVVEVAGDATLEDV
jgi:endo-1,4-beta-mannosidase